MKFLTRSNLGAAISPCLSPLLATLVLGGSVLAGPTGEVKTPRAPSSGTAAKLPAPAIEKLPSTIATEVPPGTDADPVQPRGSGLPVLKHELDRSQVFFSSETAGTVHARGTSYKARFGADGATYVPFFGSRAAASHPLSMRVEAVTLGGQALELSGAASVSRDGERVACARGAVVEQYDLAAGGVEQRFVFASLPGAGDLAVRVSVTTDLAASADESGILFSNELGSVRYGKATVLDAAGRQAPIATDLSEGTITLRVPAAFLANATFPVTIDPLITTFAVDTDLYDDYAADTAYDLDTDSFGVVYEEAFTQTDHDIMFRAFGSDGHPIPAATKYLDLSSDLWVAPRIANNRLAEQFLVVGEVGAPGQRTIQGVLVSAANHAVSPAFTISSNLSGDCLHPDVGGDPSPFAPTYYCVTFERDFAPGDHDVLARLVTPGAIPLGTSPTAIETSFGTLDTHPVISNSNGLPPSGSQAWHIAWQRTFGPGDEDIFGAALSWDGVITEPTFPIEISSANDSLPSVSSPIDAGGATREYMVVFERQLGMQSDIVGVLLEGSNYLDGEDLSLFAASGAELDQREPTVDSDGSQFLVGYGQQFSGSDYDLYVAQFNGASGVIGKTAPTAPIATDPLPDQRVELASVHSGGGSSARYLAVFDVASQSAAHDIYAAIFDAQIGGPTETFCYGTVAACPCGNAGSSGNGCANSVNAAGGHLAASGQASLAHDTLVLSGSGMPAFSNCIYLQGTATTTATFGDGLRCVGGTLIRLGLKANSNGASSYPLGGDQPISVRGVVPASGASRYYQTWYRDPASFCTPTTYNVTNGVSVVWVP